MATRLLMVVCILSALTFNRNCSCAAIIKTKNKANNFLGTPETPSIPLRALQMDQIKRLSETFASQMEVKRQLANTIQDQKESMNNLHASHRKAFFGLQDAKQQQRDTQLADEQVSQQALNNIMVVANEVDRLVQWKSVSLDTIINSNFPNLTDHLKMMISTAHANANILFNTQASSAIKDLVSRLIKELQALTRSLLITVATINEQVEAVVGLYNTVASQAGEQRQREASLLKRALENKVAEQNVFNRARALIQAMRCPNATIDDGEDQVGPVPPKADETTTPTPTVTAKQKTTANDDDDDDGEADMEDDM